MIAAMLAFLTPISPSSSHPAYWEINDTPVLLLGGSVEDNLFQIENIESHLESAHIRWASMRNDSLKKDEMREMIDRVADACG